MQIIWESLLARVIAAAEQADATDRRIKHIVTTDAEFDALWYEAQDKHPMATTRWVPPRGEVFMLYGVKIVRESDL